MAHPEVSTIPGIAGNLPPNKTEKAAVDLAFGGKRWHNKDGFGDLKWETDIRTLLGEKDSLGKITKRDGNAEYTRTGDGLRYYFYNGKFYGVGMLSYLPAQRMFTDLVEDYGQPTRTGGGLGFQTAEWNVGNVRVVLKGGSVGFTVYWTYMPIAARAENPTEWAAAEKEKSKPVIQKEKPKVEPLLSDEPVVSHKTAEAVKKPSAPLSATALPAYGLSNPKVEVFNVKWGAPPPTWLTKDAKGQYEKDGVNYMFVDGQTFSGIMKPITSGEATELMKNLTAVYGKPVDKTYPEDLKAGYGRSYEWTFSNIPFDFHGEIHPTEASVSINTGGSKRGPSLVVINRLLLLWSFYAPKHPTGTFKQLRAWDVQLQAEMAALTIKMGLETKESLYGVEK